MSKKSSVREVRKVIEQSDVVILVLDARDPEGTRCLETEQMAKDASKKLIYVMNKSDLIPAENLQAWLKHYKSEKMLTVPFESIGFKKPEKDDEGEEKPESAQDKNKQKLMDLLFKYARKFAEKRSQENIVAGVVGFTNVGKSSLINVLKGKIIVPSGSSPFITRAMRQVRLSDAVTVIDSPGIMAQAVQGSGLQLLRSAVQVDDLEDPLSFVKAVLQKLDKVEVLRYYRIADFGEKDDEGMKKLIQNISKKKGWFQKEQVKSGKTDKKGNQLTKTVQVADEQMGARRLLRDFLNNRLSYYSPME